MTVARVQLPDGRVARFEVPDGTTPQQVEAFALEQVNQTTLEKRRSTAAGIGRGLVDVGQGLKQGYLMAKDLVTGGSEAPAYTKAGTDEEKLYEATRGPGVDVPRLVGNVAATSPAMILRAPAAVGKAGSIIEGLMQGGASSGSMFTPEGKSKGDQTTAGALFGAAAQPVLSVAKAGANRLKELLRPEVSVQPGKLAGEIQLKLQTQGVDWNKLTTEAQQSLLADAENAVKAGGTLDDAMLKNKAIIESIGAKGTRASITRDPRDWQKEKNLRGIQNAGEPIVAREQENAAAMIDYLGKLRSGTGGKTKTPIETGESAVAALRAQDKEKEKAVTGLYDAFRASGAQDAQVPEAKVMAGLSRVIGDIGQENIPAAVQSRLKDFGFLGGQRTKYLTVEEADRFNRLLNNNNPGNGPSSKAVGMIKSALNDALLDVEPAGAKGVEQLKVARVAAAQRFKEQQAGTGVTAAIEDVAPDRFVQKFIIGAPAREMKATLSELGKSPNGQQAISDMRGHVLDGMLMRATGATNIDDVTGKAFSGVRFSKALDEIEPEKLHALFKPAEVEALRNLQKASKLLTEEVPFSDVNHSKTTAALANLLQKIGSTPLLGQVLSPIIGAGKIGMDWVKDAAARKQVAEILVGSAGKPADVVKLPPGRKERLVNEMAPSAAGAAGNYANQ